MPAVGEKAFEPCFGFRRGIRFADADGVKALRPRLLDKGRFDFRWLGQKSRSA
jgi:hypothetical protein